MQAVVSPTCTCLDGAPGQSCSQPCDPTKPGQNFSPEAPRFLLFLDRRASRGRAQSRRNHRGLSPAAAALLPPALEGARQRARCPASHPAQLPHHTAAHASSSGLLDIILWLRNREKPTPKKTAPELAPSTAGRLCSQDTTAHVCRKQPASPGLEGLPRQHHNTKLQRGEECNSSGEKSASGLGGGTGELQEHSWQVSVF